MGDFGGNPTLKWFCWVLLTGVALCTLLVLFTNLFDKRGRVQCLGDSQTRMAGAPPQVLTGSSYADLIKEVLQSQELNALEPFFELFIAQACLPCAMFVPLIVQFLETDVYHLFPSGQFPLVVHNCSAQSAQLCSAAVSAWPTLKFHSNAQDVAGVTLAQQNGTITYDVLKNWIEECLQKRT